MPDFPPALLEWTGHAGVALYLAAYALLQAGLIRGNGYLYTVMNLAAALCVLIGLTIAFNLSSALIQIFWVVISIAGLLRMAYLNNRARFNKEESALLADVLAQMPKPLARRFLDLGKWTNAETGLVLTTEGNPVTALHYLPGGPASVCVGGAEVGNIDSGFVGEINVLDGGEASATVTLKSDGRLFSISGDLLRHHVNRNSELGFQLITAFRSDTGTKLANSNLRKRGSAASR